MAGLKQAQWLALLIPAGLLGGAYISQYVFGLYPCEMCWWQRYPHFAAFAAGAASFFLSPKQVWAALAGLFMITSGFIGFYHAGVEYGWFPGVTACATMTGAINVLDPASAPLIRCDVAPWSLFGISLAGWNFLFSCAGGIAILILSARKSA